MQGADEQAWTSRKLDSARSAAGTAAKLRMIEIIGTLDRLDHYRESPSALKHLTGSSVTATQVGRTYSGGATQGSSLCSHDPLHRAGPLQRRGLRCAEGTKRASFFTPSRFCEHAAHVAGGQSDQVIHLEGEAFNMFDKLFAASQTVRQRLKPGVISLGSCMQLVAAQLAASSPTQLVATLNFLDLNLPANHFFRSFGRLLVPHGMPRSICSFGSINPTTLSRHGICQTAARPTTTSVMTSRTQKILRTRDEKLANEPSQKVCILHVWTQIVH